MRVNAQQYGGSLVDVVVEIFDLHDTSNMKQKVRNKTHHVSVVVAWCTLNGCGQVKIHFILGGGFSPLHEDSVTQFNSELRLRLRKSL